MTCPVWDSMIARGNPTELLQHVADLLESMLRNLPSGDAREVIESVWSEVAERVVVLRTMRKE